MNENSEIKKILQKFVLNQCNEQELAEVIAYYKKNQLTDDFPTVEEIEFLISDLPRMKETKGDAIFDFILANSTKEQTIEMEPRKIFYSKYMAIAASIVFILGIGWTFRDTFFSSKSQSIELNSNEITLQLENGEVQVITQGDSKKVKDEKGNVVGNQNGDKLVYDKTNSIKELVYNTIKIPFGKRFTLELSDGTTVHLNSGSILKYPKKFIAGLNRQVYLEGEGYFEVAKDKKHPFIVNANNLNVRVLGTHFNISNYPEDELTDVVLVEGSVGMYTASQEFDPTKNLILKPGFKGTFNKNSALMDASPVLTEIYTSWISGGLTFRNMTFKNIISKLERHYNVEIDNQNKKLDGMKFNASFSNQPIEKVLSYFNDIYGIKYTVKDKQIQIK